MYLTVVIIGIIATLGAGVLAIIAAIQIPSWMGIPDMQQARLNAIEEDHERAVVRTEKLSTAKAVADELKLLEEQRKQKLDLRDEQIRKAWWDDRSVMVKRNLWAVLCLLVSGVCQVAAVYLSASPK